MSARDVTAETPSLEPANPVSTPFQFPIRKADGSHYHSAEELHTALEPETSGHYLLGKHGFWHGGIHITDASAPQCVRDEPLRAIADGVVVAYRINRDPLTSKLGYGELQYSSSFVLIRHDYHSPANSDEGPDQGKQNSLTFYSLYQHLLPWAGYVESAEAPSNPRIKFEVGDYLAHSALKGQPGSVKYGRIPSGSMFEVLEESAPINGTTFAKGKLISGTINSLPPSKEAWFAYKHADAPLKNKHNKDIWSPVTQTERQRPGYWQGTVRAQVCLWAGLPLYFPPASPTHGAQAGGPIAWGEQFKLCLSSDIEFDNRKILNLQLNGKTVRMAECRFIDTGRGTGLEANHRMMPDSFWSEIEDQGYAAVVDWNSVEPDEFDKVVLCEHPIKAGDPVGYLGFYEVQVGGEGDKISKHQVHMEVFSADERLESFLHNEAGLRQGKQYLSLPALTQLAAKPHATAPIILTTSHVIEMNKVRSFKDPQGEAWYEFSVNENTEQLRARLRKDAVNSNFIDSPQIISQHDWHKLGYRMVEEYDPDADGYLDPDDMPDFFQELFREIDTDHDKNISSEELMAALRNPATRDRWSRLIGRYCNEWKGGSAAPFFARFTELCAGYPQVVAHEKERMDKMMFWDEVAEAVGLPVDGRVWHFHPVELVGSIGVGDEAWIITRQMLVAARPAISADYCEQILPILNKYALIYEVNTPLRIASFLGQLGHESGFEVRSENLSYSAKRMRIIFGCKNNERGYDVPTDECLILPRLRPKLWTESAFYAKNPVRLGNYVYAARNGNGDESSGDGYKYRGRGVIQLTGRLNYEAYTEIHNKRNPADVRDFVENPDLIIDELEYGIESAFVWWEINKMNGRIDDSFAATGVDKLETHVAAVSKYVNGGLIGLKERIALFKLIYGMASQI